MPPLEEDADAKVLGEGPAVALRAGPVHERHVLARFAINVLVPKLEAVQGQVSRLQPLLHVQGQKHAVLAAAEATMIWSWLSSGSNVVVLTFIAVSSRVGLALEVQASNFDLPSSRHRQVVPARLGRAGHEVASMRLAKARVRLVLLTTFFGEGSWAFGSGVLDFLPFMLMGQCLTFMNPQIRQSIIVVIGFVSFVAPSTQAAFKPGWVVVDGVIVVGFDFAIGGINVLFEQPRLEQREVRQRAGTVFSRAFPTRRHVRLLVHSEVSLVSTPQR